MFIISFLLSALPFYTVARYVESDRSNKTVGEIIESEEISKLKVETKPVILPFAILTFLISGTAEMLKGLFPVLATEYAGLNEAQTGLIYLASTLAVLVSAPLFGWLSDRGNREIILLARSISNTISSIVYIIFPGFHGFATGKLVDDMGKAAFRPAWGSLMAHVSNYNKNRRGQIMSWILVGEDAGVILGPLLAGFLWDTWGLTAMLGGRVVISIITEVYAVVFNKTLEQKDRKS